MRGLLGTYRRLLRNRPLSRLLAGEFISSIGDWLYLVALLIIIYERTQDAVLLGIVGAARVLPYVFLSLPAGYLADRYDRRMILIVTDVARGIIMLALAALVASDGSMEAIVALTIVATCFSSFFGPAIGSYLPSLVKDEADLGPANSAYATLDNVAFVIGPALAAILISTGGLTLAFLLNAATFAVVAALLWTLPPSRAGTAAQAAATDQSTEGLADGRPGEEEPAPSPAASSLWDALAPIARPVGALALIDTVAGFVFGGLGVLTVVIAYDRLGSGEAGTGALNAAVGVGGVVGALVSSLLILGRGLAGPLLLGASVLAVGLGGLGLTNSLPLAMLAMAAASLGALLLSVVDTTLFQRIVPDAIRGRTLGGMETVSVLAYAAGAFCLPALVQVVDVSLVLVASGVAVALAGAAAIPLLGSHALQVPPLDPVRASLAAVPIFAGLAPARLETAQRRAHVLEVPPGSVVIRQGDEADRFYVISSGAVEVTQHPEGRPELAPQVLRRMGPGDVFGEIGLLTGVPRTATVTTTAASTLLALDKPDFLDLVGSGAGLTFPILDLHRGAGAVGG